MSSQSNEPQITRHLLMIRPARFGHNAETAASNAFQNAGVADAAARALVEFDGFVQRLREHGLEVCVVEDTPDTETPDALFPNNWISFHADGTVVLYPMHAPNRRLERRPEVAARVCAQLGLAFARTIDLATAHEAREAFLEGTGSLLLDRPRRIAYACLSPRTHPDALADFGERLGYTVHAFGATDAAGQPIYHTNVMMALGEGFCVLCTEAIADADERALLLASLERGGHEVIPITRAQMCEFAGNLLHVANATGQRFIVGSTRAFACLDAEQTGALERHGALLAAPLDTIETVGGGSARCMLAEVFLPPAASGRLP